MKLKWSSVFVEFLSVVFAVLLALFLNAWRESIATADTLVRVKQNIREEILRNDSLVSRSLEYRWNLLTDISEGTHRIMAKPVIDFETDVYNDRELAKAFRIGYLFGGNRYYDQILVESYEDERVLILDGRVFKLEIADDTLSLYGVGGIQLRSADVKLHSWDIAQATGMLVQMNIEVVTALSKLNTWIDSYLETSNDAIKYIYEGDQGAAVSAMQDMVYFERQILESHKEVLDLLE